MNTTTRHSWSSSLANGGWILVDKVLRQGLVVLVGAWVARHLGPARYGDLAYVVALLAFFQTLGMLGLDTLLVRDIARDRAAAPALLGTALALRLGAGTAAWVGAVVAMALLQGASQPGVLLAALAGGLLVFQSADVVELWFQSQGQSRRALAGRWWAYLAAAALRVALVLADAPLWAFAAVLTIEAGLCALGLALAYRRAPAGASWFWEAARARELLRESWPFLLGGLSVVTYIRIDQLMLRQMLGSSELGLYAALLPLSQAAQFVPMSLVPALAPLVAQRKAQGERAYEDELLRVFRLFGALGLAVSLAIALLGPWIVPLLYGPAYRAAVPVLTVHAFTNFFVFQGVAQSLWVTNERAGPIAMAKTLVGALTAVAANWILLPRLGILGAAWSSVAAQAMSVWLSNLVLAPRVALMQLGLRPPPRPGAAA